jgi:hypothetical protein
MMAKITKGHNFGGAVRYVLQDKKDAKLLDSKDVLTNDKRSIINSFRLQCQPRPNVKHSVGHISLDFSVEDVDRLSDDFMAKVAREYMQRMNLLNTQYVIVRHHDREHPHCHVIFNRIDNNGKLISDRNDRIRSAKICRSLSEKFQLHIAKGKDHVNRDRLRGADAVKYRIYDALESAVPLCRNWEELQASLASKGITLSFTNRGSTKDIQGVVFEKEGLRFNGSKVDRKYSYSKISTALRLNAVERRRNVIQGRSMGVDHDDHEGYSQCRAASSIRSSARDTGLSIGSDVLEGIGSGVASAGSLVVEAGSGVVNAAVSVVSGVAKAMTAAPGVSPGGGGGGSCNSSVDLADDEYIDEYGVRRKMRHGMRR